MQAAVTPTSVFPAPHGSTITPDRARPLPNIFRKLFSWYGRSIVLGFKSMLKRKSNFETIGSLTRRLEGKMTRKVGGKRYETRSRGPRLPTPWLFEPAERPDNRADYCLDCSFLPQCKHHVLVFTLEWSGARPMGEQW